MSKRTYNDARITDHPRALADELVVRKQQHAMLAEAIRLDEATLERAVDAYDRGRSGFLLLRGEGVAAAAASSSNTLPATALDCCWLLALPLDLLVLIYDRLTRRVDRNGFSRVSRRCAQVYFSRVERMKLTTFGCMDLPAPLRASASPWSMMPQCVRVTLRPYATHGREALIRRCIAAFVDRVSLAQCTLDFEANDTAPAPRAETDVDWGEPLRAPRTLVITVTAGAALGALPAVVRAFFDLSAVQWISVTTAAGLHTPAAPLVRAAMRELIVAAPAVRSVTTNCQAIRPVDMPSRVRMLTAWWTPSSATMPSWVRFSSLNFIGFRCGRFLETYVLTAIAMACVAGAVTYELPAPVWCDRARAPTFTAAAVLPTRVRIAYKRLAGALMPTPHAYVEWVPFRTANDAYTQWIGVAADGGMKSAI